MAQDSNRASNEALNEEIQRLEKQKKDLERQQLEQRLQDLRSSVGALRSGIPSTPQRSSSGKSPSCSPRVHQDERLEAETSRDGAGTSGSRQRDLESALQESRDHLQHMQSQLFTTPVASSSPGVTKVHGVTARNKDDTSDSSSDSEKGEEVMTENHKQAIHASRDILVDNMLPDDIFNDLISRKILTTADVSRIKDKNTREAVNEELLTVLCRRSDRAFYVFVQSLRKTLQEYLANRLDPPSPRKVRKKKRKRQTGEVNINVDCEDIEPATASRRSYHSQRAPYDSHHRPSDSSRRFATSASCSCQEVEEQILQMAKEAYRNIRRRDTTPAAFEQFRKELQQTNATVKESMEMINTLKILCRHGEITAVSEGSVVLTIRCHSALSAKELWELYTSGELRCLMEKGFVTPSLKRLCRVRKIRLKVEIAKTEYLLCLQELGGETIHDSPLCCKPLKVKERRKRSKRENGSYVAGLRRRRISTDSRCACCHADITASPVIPDLSPASSDQRELTQMPKLCLHARSTPRKAFQELHSNHPNQPSLRCQRLGAAKNKGSSCTAGPKSPHTGRCILQSNPNLPASDLIPSPGEIGTVKTDCVMAETFMASSFGSASIGPPSLRSRCGHVQSRPSSLSELRENLTCRRCASQSKGRVRSDGCDRIGCRYEVRLQLKGGLTLMDLGNEIPSKHCEQSKLAPAYDLNDVVPGRGSLQLKRLAKSNFSSNIGEPFSLPRKQSKQIESAYNLRLRPAVVYR